MSQIPNGESVITDPLYQEAKGIVLANGYASVTMLQRKMCIGYTRAARLVDYMEMFGIVTAPDEIGKRLVVPQPARAAAEKDEER